MLYKITDPEFITLVEKGIPLEKLEKELRPGHSSEVGFLGMDESLLEVVYSDWQVVERHGTTHSGIAQAIRSVITGIYPGIVGRYQLHPDYEYWRGPMAGAPGYNNCPWDCNAYGGNITIITKKAISDDQREEVMIAQSGGFTSYLSRMLDERIKEYGENDSYVQQWRRIQENLKKEREPFFAIITSLLSHLIEEHYFFEGRKSPYRADPEFLIKALGLARV